MRKILEDILWSIYYSSGEKIGRKDDFRFTLINEILRDIHGYTGKQLSSALVDLKKEKLIKEKKGYNNSVSVSLTNKGLLRSISFKFRRLSAKKEKWDGKWRMVAFDIPKACEKGRKALVYRLKTGSFYEMQESIFLYPYDCKQEIDTLTELFKIKKYIRFGTLDFIDNQDWLKARFGVA